MFGNIGGLTDSPTPERLDSLLSDGCLDGAAMDELAYGKSSSSEAPADIAALLHMIADVGPLCAQGPHAASSSSCHITASLQRQPSLPPQTQPLPSAICLQQLLAEYDQQPPSQPAVPDPGMLATTSQPHSAPPLTPSSVPSAVSQLRAPVTAPLPTIAPFPWCLQRLQPPPGVAEHLPAWYLQPGGQPQTPVRHQTPPVTGPATPPQLAPVPASPDMELPATPPSPLQPEACSLATQGPTMGPEAEPDRSCQHDSVCQSPLFSAPVHLQIPAADSCGTAVPKVAQQALGRIYSCTDAMGRSAEIKLSQKPRAGLLDRLTKRSAPAASPLQPAR